MKKKNIKNIFLLLTSLILMQTARPEAANPFEDLFKDVDWEQVTKDMEKILEEMEQEEKAKEAEAASTVSKEEEAPGLKPQGETPVKADLSKKSDTELFLNPIVEKKPEKKGEKKISRPWIAQECLDASKRIFKKFEGHLQSLEKKIIAHRNIGPDYKEEFMTYAGHLGLFSAAVGNITSKTVYQRIILAPEEADSKDKKISEDMKSYRKIAVDNLKELETFDSKLKAPTVEQEEQEEEASAKKLREYAEQKTTSIEEEKNSWKDKAGKRGQKTKKSKSKKKTPKTESAPLPSSTSSFTPSFSPDFGSDFDAGPPDFGPFTPKS